MKSSLFASQLSACSRMIRITLKLHWLEPQRDRERTVLLPVWTVRCLEACPCSDSLWFWNHNFAQVGLFPLLSGSSNPLPLKTRGVSFFILFARPQPLSQERWRFYYEHEPTTSSVATRTRHSWHACAACVLVFPLPLVWSAVLWVDTSSEVKRCAVLAWLDCGCFVRLRNREWRRRRKGCTSRRKSVCRYCTKGRWTAQHTSDRPLSPFATTRVPPPLFFCFFFGPVWSDLHFFFLLQFDAVRIGSTCTRIKPCEHFLFLAAHQL